MNNKVTLSLAAIAAFLIERLCGAKTPTLSLAAIAAFLTERLRAAKTRKVCVQRFLTGVIACLVLAGCQSVQKDIMLSSAGETTFAGLEEIEESVISLEGAGTGTEEIAEARRKIDALEAAVADPDFGATLAAWSGRLYLIEGKSADARRELQKSRNLSSQNLQGTILSFRLERDAAKRLSLVDQSLKSGGASGELLAERGRVLFDLNRFSECVAAFDSAFLALSAKPCYEEAYRVFRDKAWELKDMETGMEKETLEIARLGEITWKDLVEITMTETDLLRFITAGRGWPAETLFTQLSERALIPYTQNVSLAEWPSAKPSSSEIVLRSGAAWFLWHIYAENRANRGLLTRYSSRYANTPNARSPIPDTTLSSPFLDSIMGCVESEFISLPDGRNFLPGERVKGAEFLSMLRKLER